MSTTVRAEQAINKKAAAYIRQIAICLSAGEKCDTAQTTMFLPRDVADNLGAMDDQELAYRLTMCIQSCTHGARKVESCGHSKTHGRIFKLTDGCGNYPDGGIVDEEAGQVRFFYHGCRPDVSATTR